MRASRSWPRSSVPSGCARDGPFSLALKSISLIGTRYTYGPISTATTNVSNTVNPTMARRWRRKRRVASRHNDVRGGLDVTSRAAGAVATLMDAISSVDVAQGLSSVRDPRVEPAVKKVGHEIEDDDQAREHERDGHDHRRVVREDRADQQRADAGDAEDLLGDDGARENAGDLQREQRHHGDERVSDDVLHHRDALRQAFGARGIYVIETDHVDDRRAHEAGQRRALEEAEHGDGHRRLAGVLPPPAPARGRDVGLIDERQPVEPDTEHQNEDETGEEGR